MKFSLIRLTFLFAVLAALVHAQELPDRIDGYKVHRADITVSNDVRPASTRGDDALITISGPRLVDVGLAGAILEVDAELAAIDRSGTVERVTFREFTVNGVAVKIDEYSGPFQFERGVPLRLDGPIRIVVPLRSVAKAAYKEFSESPSVWEIVGTAFVFGKFKKFGFTFKRVIPVPVRITIADPLNGISEAAR